MEGLDHLTVLRCLDSWFATLGDGASSNCARTLLGLLAGAAGVRQEHERWVSRQAWAWRRSGRGLQDRPRPPSRVSSTTGQRR